MVPISTEGTRGKETLRNAAMRATDVRHDSPVHSELTSNFQWKKSKTKTGVWVYMHSHTHLCTHLGTHTLIHTHPPFQCHWGIYRFCFHFYFACAGLVSIYLTKQREDKGEKKAALCFLETSSLCLTSHLRLNLWQGGRLRQRQYPSSREAPSYTLPLRSPWRTRCRTFSTNHAVFSHPRWRKAFLRSELHPHTLVEARTTRSHQALSCSCTFVFWGAENDFVPRIYLEKHM